MCEPLPRPDLPAIGTRVFVTGTRHHGFRGTVVEKKPEWNLAPRAVAVKLDEWDNPYHKFYCHNLLTLP